MTQIRTSLSAKRGIVTAIALEHYTERTSVETRWRPYQKPECLDVQAEHYRAAVALSEMVGMSSWPTLIGVDRQGRRYWHATADVPAQSPLE